MFVVYPINIDYLINDVRLQLGDLDGTKFSDSIIRTGLLNGVTSLQRRWKHGYIRYASSMYIDPLPSGYCTQDYYTTYSGMYDLDHYTIIPSGYILVALSQGYRIIPGNLNDNDIFRDPDFVGFSSENQNPLMEGYKPICQEDEYPIVLAAAVLISRANVTSSASSLQSWSDGMGLSFSNLSTGNVITAMHKSLEDELDKYFKQRLASAKRDSFAFKKF